MNTLMQIVQRPVTSQTQDGAFSRWACSGAAVALFLLATIFFIRNAQDPGELVAGIGLALATAALCHGTGVLTARLHFALLEHKLPVRMRVAEFAGYTATLGILISGVLYLPTLALQRTGMTMGLLVILAASLTASCLGALSTLWAVRQRQNSLPPT